MADVEFQYQYESITLTVTLEFDSYHDANYGADADGNRGTPMDFFEPDDIHIYDEKNIEVTPFFERDDPETYELLQQKAEEKANSRSIDDVDYNRYYDNEDDY